MLRKILVSSLAIVSAALVVLSTLYPWWVMTVREIVTNRRSYIHIYAYGLVHNITELRQWVLRHETPPHLMLAAKVYLYGTAALVAAAAVLILKSRSKLASRLLAGLGALYLLYTLAFLPVLHEGTSTAPEKIPMQGELWIYLYEYSLHVVTYFDAGYYLSLASSILLIATGLVAARVLKDGKAG
jgi:hypothetical protein